MQVTNNPFNISSKLSYTLNISSKLPYLVNTSFKLSCTVKMYTKALIITSLLAFSAVNAAPLAKRCIGSCADKNDSSVTTNTNTHTE